MEPGHMHKPSHGFWRDTSGVRGVLALTTALSRDRSWDHLALNPPSCCSMHREARTEWADMSPLSPRVTPGHRNSHQGQIHPLPVSASLGLGGLESPALSILLWNALYKVSQIIKHISLSDPLPLLQLLRRKKGTWEKSGPQRFTEDCTQRLTGKERKKNRGKVGTVRG